MERATTVLPRRDVAPAGTMETVTLDRAARYRRRFAMTTDSGMDFLLDLPEATYLADGDALLLEDGRVILVCAAAENLLEVRASDSLGLMRIAWHIGNRHTPCEITTGALYIQPDHVLAEMVEGLGGRVCAVVRAFEPEGGAYGGKGPLAKGHHHHGHVHGDDRQHRHGHGHHDADEGAESRLAGPAIWRPEGS